MTKRRITCLCLAVLLLMPMLLSGCGKKIEKALAPYAENSKVRCDEADSTVENDNYILMWNDAYQRFALGVKETDEWFYSAPLDAGSDDPISAPIDVTYIEVETAVTPTPISGAKNCLAEDNYSSERIENGFRAVYSFAEAQIAVTVEYLLHDDGLEIRIPMDGLQENDKRIVDIKVAPFMASVEVGNGSYLMVPSGSGALIYADEGVNQDIAQYQEAVYGEDQCEPMFSRSYNYSQIYMPVFGTMNQGNNTGMVGIVEEGVDCAWIYASVGGQYANVYPSFRIRARENIVYNESGGTKGSTYRFSYDTPADREAFSVRYIPLSAARGEDITYNGMASCYRAYLQKLGYLKDRVETVPALSLNMLGATQITDSFFGVPYKKDVATTTLAQTQKIASELKELIGEQEMLLSLTGYGQGGLANTTVGGGFSLSSKVGNKKDLAALREYAEKNGITLSMDYELGMFQGSGGGVKVGRDAVIGVSSLKMEKSTYTIHTGQEDTKGLSWYLLGRKQLVPMIEKAMSTAKKNQIGGISIGSLNRIMYSDFNELEYVAMAGFADTVSGALAQDDVQVIANKANAYVAMNADYVTEVPQHSSVFDIFDEDIPFYSLVFQGYVPLASSSINLAVNTRDTYLEAVATGMALQFTLCNTLHESIQYDEDSAFVSSRYADWKDQIAAMVEESNELHAKVGNQAIVRYEKHGDVSVTEFENGTIVLVNYADEAVTYDGVELAANSFVCR